MARKRSASCPLKEFELLLRGNFDDELIYGSMFSGMDSGAQALQNLGIKFTHAFAIDSCAACREVLAMNFNPAQVVDDVKSADKAELCYTDLFQFSPPCQNYSKAGLQKGAQGKQGNLAKYGARYVNRYMPGAFLMEQVPAYPNEFPREAKLLMRSLKKSGKYIVKDYMPRCFLLNISRFRQSFQLWGGRVEVYLGSKLLWLFWDCVTSF